MKISNSTHRIALKAKVAHPKLRPIVDLTHWIQYRTTLRACTHDGLVLDDIVDVAALLERVQASQRHDELLMLDPTRWPDVPGESDAVAVLILLDKFFVCAHGDFAYKDDT